VGFGTLPGEVVAHAFLWQKGTLTDLDTVGTLGGSLNSAYNVNEQGHVVGVSLVPNDSVYHAVLWRNGESTDLETVTGDACSQPTRINSSDQIVGASFACDFTVFRAFLWESGELWDLNTLIAEDSGLELETASWITDDGVIAAQAVLTAGDNAGASRAVFLIPLGGCSGVAQAASRGTLKKAASQSSDGTMETRGQAAIVKTEDGRLNRMLLRPFSLAKLSGTKKD
jgi:probable HAF family extracellular repeat protein